MRLTPCVWRDMLGVLFLLFIDQISKYAVVAWGVPYVMNSGIIGGFLASWHISGIWWILASVAVLAVVWQKHSPVRFFFTAGILGNLIDRVWHGAVIDFLDISIGWFHWPMFNMADVYLTVGAALILLSFRSGK